ncbi:bifunctional 4-hydroxy-2-oxoglutarate aldolase/2-dehydro-3-deoxy-phosphogluconate aldolase [Lachnospiraceae bacterium 54-53]
MHEIIKENPVVAILRNVPDDRFLNYVEALMLGNLKCIEIAMNTSDAQKQIREVKRVFGKEVLVGAGTVISTERAKRAREAGAEFFLSPSSDVEVMKYCREEKISLLPGVFTPTDVSLCLSYGYDVLKLFPAGDAAYGYVKSLKGPLNEADFVAVGGVSPENMESFFERGFIGVGIGSNLVPKSMLEEGKWAEITDEVRRITERRDIFNKEKGGRS